MAAQDSRPERGAHLNSNGLAAVSVTAGQSVRFLALLTAQTELERQSKKALLDAERGFAAENGFDGFVFEKPAVTD